jgi:8-oxo-dGTP pyrophosphatase MutT (NUDIX family)
MKGENQMASAVIANRKIYTHGDGVERVITSKKLIDYMQRVDPRLRIESVDVLWAKYKTDHSLLFAVVNVEMYMPNGKPVQPGLVVLSGDATAVLLVYIDEKGVRHGLTVTQPRAAVGELEYEELPAGMNDLSDDPRSVAIREVFEETLQRITEDQLIDLGFTVPSPGLKAEAVHLFAVEIHSTQNKIKVLNGLNAGIAADGEYTQTRVSELSHILERVTDAKTEIAIRRYLAQAA